MAIFLVIGFNSVSASDLNNVFLDNQTQEISLCNSDCSIDSNFINADENLLNESLADSDSLYKDKEYSDSNSNSKNNLKSSSDSSDAADSYELKSSAKSALASSNLSKPILTTGNLNAYYRSKNFTAKLTDSNNKPIVGAKIYFTVLSKTYQKITDSSGIARLMINLYPGNYSISTRFAGDGNYSSVSKTNTIKISKKKLDISSSNLVKKYGNSERFQVRISDGGSGVANLKLALEVCSKTYVKVTDENGIASLAINLGVGKYTIKSYIYKNSGYYSNTNSNTITVNSQNPYKLTVLKWGTKGNIKKNSVLMKNISKTSLANAIIAACNNGTPLIQFGNGSGKKVFIVSGVHGKELASQAAAFKLINTIYNMKQKINGTVYIVPVLCPKITELNTREYNGVNLNSVANKKGTVSYKLVNYAKSLGVVAVGDFHCTMPNGDPGKNVAMGTYSPTASSATLAKYISKSTGYSYLIYKKAGEEYPGAVEDVLNLKGITSVTCEALTPHGKIASGSLAVSFNMMKAFLKYYGINLS